MDDAKEIFNQNDIDLKLQVIERIPAKPSTFRGPSGMIIYEI